MNCHWAFSEDLVKVNKCIRGKFQVDLVNRWHIPNCPNMLGRRIANHWAVVFDKGIAMENTTKYLFLSFLVHAAASRPWASSTDATSRNRTFREAALTFVYPLMVQWSNQYEKSEYGSRIGYRFLVPGAGIRWFSKTSSISLHRTAP